MPYCGMSWVTPGVTTCPDGSKPTNLPAGQEAAPGETSTLPNDPTYMWNQDTTPVIVGTEKQYVGGGGGLLDVPQTTTVADAMNIFYDIRGKGTSANATKADKQAWSNLLGSLRAYTNQELGTADAQASAFGQVLKYASRSGESVPAILSGATGEDAGFIDDSGPGGVGAYTGPRTTVSMASERDLRMTADAIASTVLGRAVTDDEFQNVLKQVRSAEKAEPSVTTGGVGMTTSQAGLSAEGRQDIIREALSQGPEAESFGRATKMMDLFYSALEERPSGA